eukprot:5315388-Prymnesium_polylepis.1
MGRTGVTCGRRMNENTGGHTGHTGGSRMWQEYVAGACGRRMNSKRARHLVTARRRLDEVGVRCDVGFDLLAVRRQLEEVRRLRHPLDGSTGRRLPSGRWRES